MTAPQVILMTAPQVLLMTAPQVILHVVHSMAASGSFNSIRSVTAIV